MAKRAPTNKSPADAAKKKELTLPTGKLAMTKDPRVWARKLPAVAPQYRRILGLDLASSCGVSFCDIMPSQPITEAVIIGGQWNLSVGQYDTNSIRYVRLKQFLSLTAPDLIFYEEVKYTGQRPAPGMKMNLQALVARAVSGAQVVHGLAAILVMWAEERNIPCQAVPIGTLKKYATDNGGSGKEAMIAACNAQFGTEFNPDDYKSTGADNIADSMFLCAMAVQNCSEGV